MTEILEHPFAHAKGRLEIIPNDTGIDVEAECQLYDAICEDLRTPTQSNFRPSHRPNPPRPRSPPPASIFSKDSVSIWLGDEIGQSSTFARDVHVNGWTSVGDTRAGAYIVYDIAIKTKEGTTFHILKRYSAFDELDMKLFNTLPHHLHHHIPQLPPKSPLAKYRPAFLEKRRRQLELYLSAILLHPEIGGCSVVRNWVTET